MSSLGSLLHFMYFSTYTALPTVLYCSVHYTNCISEGRPMTQFCLRGLLLAEEEVKEGNSVWHVDSRLNFPGALKGQLLNFNCFPFLLEEHQWGKF